MTRNALSSGAAGGYGATRAHRLVRRRLLSLAAAVVTVGLTGCATKADVRDVRQDLTRLEARQDSIYQLLARQNREIMDSLGVATERLLNVRGDLGNQLSRLHDQLEQVGQLTGQVQIRLNQLDQELTAAVREIRTSAVETGQAAAAAGDTGGPGSFSMAQELYDAGLEQVGRNNPATARRAFQMVVDSFPSHATAPEAQRQIGETLAMEGQFDEALRAFERVVEQYQESDSAPRALYRAGIIAQERGQTERAREYFRRVISAYPGSDARTLAEDALERM